LDAFKPYIEERLKAGVWNAQVLLRELRARGYAGGYTILKGWLHPQRESAQTVAVRRFETPPGKQAQVDWGHLGTIEMDGGERRLNGFAFTLGYSRTMMAEAALDQKLGTLPKMYEEAFRQLGGVPEEIHKPSSPPPTNRIVVEWSASTRCRDCNGLPTSGRQTVSAAWPSMPRIWRCASAVGRQNSL
jgi:transposase